MTPTTRTEPKCPECGSRALTLGMATSTSAFCPPFIDESGNMHHHDTNRSTQDYHCVKCYHCFTVELPQRRCQCGWPNLEDHA